jgi:hypothetical protein
LRQRAIGDKRDGLGVEIALPARDPSPKSSWRFKREAERLFRILFGFPRNVGSPRRFTAD